MKKPLLAIGLLLGLLGAAGVVLAQQGATVNPTPGSVWTWLGPTFGADWVIPPQISVAYTPSNAALAASTLTGGQIYRAGFYAPGDGGGALYTYSSTPCSLNAGVGDNGGQVKSIAGGCWNIDVNAQRLIPEIWGAKGTGTDNDAAMVNAALNYVGVRGSGAIFAKEGSKYGIGGMITVKQNTSFTGAGWANSQIILLNGGFSPAIKMEQKTVLQDWVVDATAQTAGTVIALGTTGADFQSLVNRVLTRKGCLALDVNGVSHTVRDSSFEEMNAAAGCGGVRVGHNTGTAPFAGQTVEFRIVDTLIKCDFTVSTRADYGLLLEDANGIFVSNIDNIGCVRGTIIRPGANQSVDLNFFNNSALGDSNQEEGLLIDTAAVSATVRSNSFVNTWTSGATLPNGTGVRIRNTGGGMIAGTSFIGHRAMQNLFDAINLHTPVAGTITGTAFDMLRVCNTQAGSNIVVGANSDIAIRHSKLGKSCDGHSAGATIQLLYGLALGPNVRLTAIGNDLTYNGPESWSPVSGFPGAKSVIANNSIDLTAGPSYNATDTVTLTILSKRYHLVAAAAATVNTITPTYDGMETCFIGENAAGAITFGTAGNIRNTKTIPAGGGMVCGYFDPSFNKWTFQ